MFCFNTWQEAFLAVILWYQVFIKLFVSRQSVKYQTLVEERLRHGDLLTFLCEDLLASLRNSLEMAEQMQQSDLKVQHIWDYPQVKWSTIQNQRDTQVHSKNIKGICLN